MKRSSRNKGLFGRFRGEAEYLENLVKKAAKRAPVLLESARKHLKRISDEHIRPDLARGIKVIARALDQVSRTLAPESTAPGRKARDRTRAGGESRASARGSRRASARRKKSR